MRYGNKVPLSFLFVFNITIVDCFILINVCFFDLKLRLIGSGMNVWIRWVSWFLIQKLNIIAFLHSELLIYSWTARRRIDERNSSPRTARCCRGVGRILQRLLWWQNTNWLWHWPWNNICSMDVLSWTVPFISFISFICLLSHKQERERKTERNHQSLKKQSWHNSLCLELEQPKKKIALRSSSKFFLPIWHWWENSNVHIILSPLVLMVSGGIVHFHFVLVYFQQSNSQKNKMWLTMM